MCFITQKNHVLDICLKKGLVITYKNSFHLHTAILFEAIGS